MEKQIIKRNLNLVIFISVMSVSALVMLFEGYLKTSLRNKPFMIFGGLIILFDFYIVLCQMSTKRLISLIPVAGVAGYITQIIGTKCNIWVYTNHGKTFYIAIFMFISVAIAMYGLTTKISLLIQSISRVNNKLFNMVWIGCLFVFLIITSQKFKSEIDASFWVYYSFLCAFALYSSLKLNLSALMGITISAWLIGFASEYFGSQAGIWLFEKNNNFPPAFLVGGSWPLEFTLHYCLSAMIAKEEY
ncbi:MAG: hypothetical protein NG747_06385 [Candidatus Brocadia sp.]|nr:hypothetical protein [Candidatus Brocadia sp.]